MEIDLMTTASFWRAGLLAFGRIVRLVPVLALVGFSMDSCDTLTKAMADLGLKRLQPPRNRVEPGVLVVMEDLADGATGVRVVCWREQAFPGLAPAAPDPTMREDVTRKVEKEFKLEAAYLEKIKGSAKYKGVDEIRLTISNASFLEYSDEELYGKLGSRVESCKQAVKAREAANTPVYTLSQALRADVSYTVSGKSDTGASVQLSQEVLEGLKAELGGSSVSEATQSITGEHLHWGVRPERIAVTISPGAIEPVEVHAKKLTDAERAALVRGAGILLSPDSDADKL